jgi:hypothetical protein
LPPVKQGAASLKKPIANAYKVSQRHNYSASSAIIEYLYSALSGLYGTEARIIRIYQTQSLNSRVPAAIPSLYAAIYVPMDHQSENNPDK